MRVSEPQQLGDFEVLGKIGQGAMGTVYRARQTSLGRIVALKLLPAHYASDADFLTRFKREAMAAATLNHANIVQIYSAGEDDGAHYFAMEFVDGESLGARIERKVRIEPHEALAAAYYVAQALAYAWSSARMVHRDIKPDNIFLSRKGAVKLGDLGLAKALGDQAAGLTQTGTAMGTPYYVSPEQAMGTGEVDFRSDIYSLGCTVFHAISGQPPYRGDSAMAVMLKHISQPPPRILDVWSACPPPIVGLLDRMLRKKPDERFESYEELLGKFLWAMERLDNPVPPAVAAASMVVQMPAARSTPGDQPVPATRVVAPQTPRRSRKIQVVVASAAAVVIAVLILQSWKKAAPHGALAPTVATTDSSKMETPNATPVPVDTLPTTANPVDANKAEPFMNSLGMRFVPVSITGGPTGGKRVLFSVWETRVQDYEPFTRETKREWIKASFKQSPTHPAVNVCWEDAQAFCIWLTDRERKMGRLSAADTYRLPTDHEWSCAVGIGEREDPSQTPDFKKSKIKEVYPWGSVWPPPVGAGNYGGEETLTSTINRQKPIVGYRDGFPETAPVGSFAPNVFGVHDLGGNVWEWCSDKIASSGMFPLRGAAFDCSTNDKSLSSWRILAKGNIPLYTDGVRCVLEVGARAADYSPGTTAISSAPSVTPLKSPRGSGMRLRANAPDAREPVAALIALEAWTRVH